MGQTGKTEVMNNGEIKPLRDQLENASTIALSAKALKNIEKLAFPNGAILSCACGTCGYSKEKTAEEMSEYLKSWPKMHGYPANVKPK